MEMMLVFDSDDDSKEMMDQDVRVPDAFIDGTQYANIFATTVDDLDKFVCNDFQSGLVWMMNCINNVYDEAGDDGLSAINTHKCTDTITALSYMVMTLFNSVEDPAFKDEYVAHQKDTIIPSLFKNCKTIPYYDVLNEVIAIDDALSGIDFSALEDND